MSERRSAAVSSNGASSTNEIRDIESSSNVIDQHMSSRIQMVPLLGSRDPIEIERTRDRQVGIRRRDPTDVSGKRGFRVVVPINKFLMWFGAIFVALPLFCFVYILSKHFIKGKNHNDNDNNPAIIDNNNNTIDLSSLIVVQNLDEEILVPVASVENEEETTDTATTTKDSDVDAAQFEVDKPEPVYVGDYVAENELNNEPNIVNKDTEKEEVSTKNDIQDTSASAVSPNAETTSSKDTVADSSEIIV